MAPLAASQVTKNGKLAWCVSVGPREGARKRFRVFRATEQEALSEARRRLGEKQQYGPELADLSRAERSLMLHWRTLAPDLDADQIESAIVAAQARRQGGMLVRLAVAAYLKAPREQPLSPEHRSPLEVRLADFTAHFGERPMASITTGALQDYVRSKAGSSPNYFSALRALYRHALAREWIAVNPMASVKRPEPEIVDREIFTPEQMMTLLKAAHARQEPVRARKGGLLRYLVLCGFAGLRHTEALRLMPGDVDLEEGELHIRRMKTRRRGIRERYVTLEPMALAWLKFTGIPQKLPVVALNDANLRRARLEICRPWLDNGLRRSFGSYHLAAFEDAARTAELMGHTDAQTTKSKYRVPRKKAVAVAWWALTVERVLSGS